MDKNGEYSNMKFGVAVRALADQLESITNAIN